MTCKTAYALDMSARKIRREKRLQKKFEVSAAHLSKCFEMISKTFGDIYNGSMQSDKDIKVVEKLERSARFFSNRNKGLRFYKVPSFFYFIRHKLREVKTLNLDFGAFEKACRDEWDCLKEQEKKRFVKEVLRFKRLRQKVGGFELFSNPDKAEKRFFE